MRTLVRLALLTLLVGGTVAGAASAGPQIGAVGAPTFTVTVTVPPTIQRGQVATVHVAITNLTEAKLVAKPSWVLTGPFKVTPTFKGQGRFSVTVPAFGTVQHDLKFLVTPAFGAGSYHLVVTVPGAAAPATADFAVT